MELRFDESHIQYWARQYEKEYLTSRNGEREKELMGMRCEVQQKGYLTQEVLEEIVIWTRSQRQLNNIRQNSNKDIKAITSQAFKTEDKDESLSVLKGLDGVGNTIGSAILHLFHKDKYPIYSKYALESVGERKAKGVWRPYVKYCRDLAARNKVEIRTLDRALCKYSHENNS